MAEQSKMLMLRFTIVTDNRLKHPTFQKHNMDNGNRDLRTTPPGYTCTTNATPNSQPVLLSLLPTALHRQGSNQELNSEYFLIFFKIVN